MVLGFLGNVAGNLNQDAFQKGTTDELNLQALQRAEQNRLNREFFREKQGGPPALPTPEALNQGMSGGLNLDNFGDLHRWSIENKYLMSQKILKKCLIVYILN